VVSPNFTTRPRGGLLFDLDTGRVLWQQHPLRELPIASLTKMMTALLVVENEAPATRVLITRVARHAAGSKVGVLPLHKHIRLETMLYGLLLPSGNDAAVALAQKVSGSQREFIALMNTRAHQLNLSCTHFMSPSGIVDKGNHSCAVDLAALAKAMLDEPRLAKIVATKKAMLKFPIKGGKLYLFNNNPLLKTDYPGTLGVKTGYTDAAGHSLVAVARRGGHRLGVVLLHSPNIGKQARVLLDRGFAAVGAT
jgi:D-alanyl-D-alanine carboxypeptidase